jgi:hypothetical protein
MSMTLREVLDFLAEREARTEDEKMLGVISRVREAVIDSAESGEWVYENLYFGSPQNYPDGAEYRFRGGELNAVYEMTVDKQLSADGQKKLITDWVHDPKNILSWRSDVSGVSPRYRVKSYVDWSTPEGWNAYLGDRLLGTWGWDTYDSTEPLDAAGYPANSGRVVVSPLLKEDFPRE